MKYVIAENYLCFLALLEMIIGDATLSNVTQQEIAEELGVVVPYGYETDIKNKKYSNIENDYGVNVSEEAVQNLFVKMKLNLSIKYIDGVRLNEIDLDCKLTRYIKERKYIIFAFSYGALYDKKEHINLGHTVLLENLVDDNIIQIYDPGPDASGQKRINIFKMYDAMKVKGGLYIISA